MSWWNPWLWRQVYNFQQSLIRVTGKMHSLITCNNVLLPQVDKRTKTNFGYHVSICKTSSFHRLALHNYIHAANFSVIDFYDFSSPSKLRNVLRNHVVTHLTQVRTPDDTCLWFNVNFITQKILSQWFKKKIQYATNQLICSQVKLHFQNHKQIFCKTILLRCFNIFIVALCIL